MFRYRLTSKLKLLGISLGYNGIIVGLKQNKRYLEIGGGFLGGSSTSWENFEWSVGATIQLVAVYVPLLVDTKNVGFTIIDGLGNELYNRQAGGSTQSFSAGSVIDEINIPIDATSIQFSPQLSSTGV